MTKLTLTPRRSGLLEALLKHQSRKPIQLGRSPAPFLFSHAKQVTAILVVVAFFFGLWFGVSTHHALGTSYPYYDTQKAVPPWSEPKPLEGNHKPGGDYK